MSTNQQQRQRRAPELALRLRKSAAILTRAACLLASDGQTMSGTAARYLTMTGLIQRVRDELFPDHLAAARKEQWIRKERVLDDKHRRILKKRLKEEQIEDAAWAWAYALIPQDPIDQSPEVGELIRAARTLKRMAEQAEHPLPTAAELRQTERQICKLEGFTGSLSISATGSGFVATMLHFNGASHDLITAESLSEMVAKAEEAAAGREVSKLRAEAERFGMRLVRKGAA